MRPLYFQGEIWIHSLNILRLSKGNVDTLSKDTLLIYLRKFIAKFKTFDKKEAVLFISKNLCIS